MSEHLYADPAGMRATADRVRTFAHDVSAQGRPARSGAAAVTAATGEFAAQLGSGADTFATSWAAAVTVYAECGELVADNLGSSAVVLTGVDGVVGATLPAVRRVAAVGGPVAE